jgi:hypothetical protein
MQFSELIGQEIAVLIPKIHHSDLQRVLVVGVEGGGIWIESQDATSVVLQKLNLAASPRTIVFFLPYHEIMFAMAGAAGTALDEKAFGV